MTELSNLSGILFEVEQARMALRRTRDILDGIKYSLEARINKLHSSDEYQEELQRQLLEENK